MEGTSAGFGEPLLVERTTGFGDSVGSEGSVVSGMVSASLEAPEEFVVLSYLGT